MEACPHCIRITICSTRLSARQLRFSLTMQPDAEKCLSVVADVTDWLECSDALCAEFSVAETAVCP